MLLLSWMLLIGSHSMQGVRSGHVPRTATPVIVGADVGKGVHALGPFMHDSGIGIGPAYIASAPVAVSNM